MKLAYEGADVEILSCAQTDMTDLQFLSKLGEDNDFVIKIADETLYIVKQDTLENAPVVAMYKEAVASYWVPHTKKPKSAKAIARAKEQDELKKAQPEYVAAHQGNSAHRSGATKPKKDKYKTEHYLDKANIKGGGKTLHIRQKFDNATQAKEKALAMLKQKNRGEYRISATLPGHPLICAGVTIYIVDYGRFDGKYFVDNVTHSKTKSSGYVTSFTAHMCLGDVIS
jgi:phage protein D